MFDLKLRETNIIKIIEDSLSKLSSQNHVAIKLKSSLDDEVMWIDHELMVTTFFDLEQNAIEAMPDGGLLTITVEGDTRQVTITLTDTGTGIAEENIPLLFTPFFTTKPPGRGTGLGLSICYDIIVEKHKGTLTVDCPESGGSVFSVRIPKNL